MSDKSGKLEDLPSVRVCDMAIAAYELLLSGMGSPELRAQLEELWRSADEILTARIAEHIGNRDEWPTWAADKNAPSEDANLYGADADE